MREKKIPEFLWKFGIFVPEMLKMSVRNKKVAEKFGSLQQMCYLCTVQ